MKRIAQNNRLPWIAVLLLGTSMALLSAHTQPVRREQAMPLGRLSAQQVLTLSEPICRTLAADAGPLTLNAEESRGGRNAWDVLCTDAAGHDVLNLSWNADTGELFAVGSCRREDLRHVGPLLNAAQAIALSRFWLRSLRIRPASGEWGLQGSPHCDAEQHHWSLSYTGGQRRVLIEIEAHTGALLSVWCPFDS